MITVEVPITTKNPTNTREHWAARAKRVKAQRGATRIAMWSANYGQGINPLCVQQIRGTLTVTLTRVSPRTMDDDGAIAAMKHVRDEVAAYFSVNDNDPRITWAYAQAKGAACIRISFEVVP